MMAKVMGLPALVARRSRRAASLLGMRPPPRLVAGPPPGVEWIDLDELCERLVGAPLRSVCHQHTSGWKSSGAYRVVLTGATGATREIFCKVNDHRPEEIAALEDLPVTVGPPELAVLRAARYAPVKAHVPALYSFTRQGEVRTTLFMESLGRTWHSCTTWPRDVIRAASEAATVQTMLREQFGESPPDELIRYDGAFSTALNGYALDHLKAYSAHVSDELVDQVLARWNEVADACLVANDRRTPTIVHGDFNLANVFMHVSRQRLKVLDWEWAGIGDGYRDLAALLKRAPRQVELDALRAYHRVAGGEPDWGHYQKLQVERGLLDASFLSVQFLDAVDTPRMNMPRFIRTSLRRAISGLDELRAT